MIEDVMSYLWFAIAVISLWTVIRKGSASMSELRAINDLQYKDIDWLLKNKDKMWEVVSTHESRIWNIDVEFAKMNANFVAVKETLERIEKKLGI